MKSAYELAMERLEKEKPSIKLSEEQREELASIDSKYKAKIAEKELHLNGLIQKAQEIGDLGELDQLQEQLRREVSRLERACEEEKEKVRQGA